MIKSYFKISLGNWLKCKEECPRYTWPGKTSRCEPDTDARRSRPRPLLPVRHLWLVHTCARAQTQKHAPGRGGRVARDMNARSKAHRVEQDFWSLRMVRSQWATADHHLLSCY